MIKLFKQVMSLEEGSVRLAIGIEGSNKEEIEQTGNSFYNWGCTDKELEWMSDKFAYFFTTEAKLRKYCHDISEHRFYLKHGVELKERHTQEYFSKKAEEMLKQFIQEKFIRYGEYSEFSVSSFLLSNDFERIQQQEKGIYLTLEAKLC